MKYKLNVVRPFALSLANAVGSRKDIAKPLNTWAEFEAQITLLKKSAEKSKVDFSKFVTCISEAKQFLQTNKSAESEHQFLDDHLTWADSHLAELKKKEPKVFKNVSSLNKTAQPKERLAKGATTKTTTHTAAEPAVVTASPAKTSGSATAAAGGEVNSVDNPPTPTPEMTQFLGSEAFKNLKEYQAKLANDDRSHSYFCGLINLTVNKADVLKALIESLEQSPDLASVNAKLEDFYDSADYVTLNAGQNITTRFFSMFGMRSTTVAYLDELVKLAKFNASPSSQM